MSGDIIIMAAKQTVEACPAINGDIAEQLDIAHKTLAQLRLDMAELTARYRAWRRAARCGRAANDSAPTNLDLTKRMRTIWATYRLTQMIARDLKKLADISAKQPQPDFGLKIVAPYAPRHPQNAQQLAAQKIEDEMDSISYEALELRYGPSLAQKLFDEITAQTEYDRAERLFN